MMKIRGFAGALAITGLIAVAGCSSGNQAPPPAPAPAPAPAPPPPPPAPQSVEVTPSLIRSVQAALKKDNLYHGRIDGVFGPGTKRGLMQYQRQNQLQATGQIDVPTLQSLNLAPPPAAGGGGMPMGGAGMPAPGAPPAGGAPAPAPAQQ